MTKTQENMFMMLLNNSNSNSQGGIDHQQHELKFVNSGDLIGIGNKTQ